MSNLVVFPWMNREEVRFVYEELFSTDVIKQKHAIERISVWKSRSKKRLPAAVESTSSFINAHLASREVDASSFGVDFHLRNLYSMAVIRFVNHITEKGQQGAFAKPVHVVAAVLGVPEWIVELRHEATHGSLPSLNELTAASSWALEWLKKNFWEPQTSETFGIASLSSAAGDILKDSLVTYMQRRFKEISSGEASSNKQLLVNIDHMFKQLGSNACPILIADGYLIPTVEQLDSLGYNYADLHSNGSLLLPPKVLEFWKKVILLMVKTNLIAELSLHMASVITEESSPRNFLVLCWLYTFIWHNQSDKIKRNKSKSHLFPRPIEMPYMCLLEKCIYLRNKDAESLINLLVENANLDIEQKQNLKHFLSVCKTVDKCNEENSFRKVSNIADIQDIVHEDRKSWKKCLEPVDWSNHPIGLLPNQTLDYTCLDLSSSQNNLSVDIRSLSWESDEEEMDDQSSLDLLNTGDSQSASVNDISKNNSDQLAYSSQLQWNDKMKLTISNKMQLF
ncbi:uncharacterized protein LOC132744527 [Ruditapes philippinarum]|uniref:uncharacterized protein LOC132744527 n=1 Tax=Ruditapes philippinarum TaxID=129788 RepID=UPI00295AF2BB|nr:uncharacterized protein LOC132744527 [Ruditapes philippinarum]